MRPVQAISVTPVDDDGWLAAPCTLDSLEAYQAVVGGYIEPIPTDESISIYVNDDGKRDGQLNPVAMIVWLAVDEFGCINAGDWIAGPCVIVGPTDRAGNDTDCPAWVYELLGLQADTTKEN